MKIFCELLEKYRHWLLRIALASVFLYHGTTKLPVAEEMATMLNMSVIIIYLIATVEIIGAFLIIIGGLFKNRLATRLAGLLLGTIMLGAISLVHWGQWGFVATTSHPMGGMEFQVTLLLIALYFLVTGHQEE